MHVELLELAFHGDRFRQAYEILRTGHVIQPLHLHRGAHAHIALVCRAPAEFERRAIGDAGFALRTVGEYGVAFEFEFVFGAARRSAVDVRDVEVHDSGALAIRVCDARRDIGGNGCACKGVEFFCLGDRRRVEPLHGVAHRRPAVFAVARVERLVHDVCERRLHIFEIARVLVLAQQFSERARQHAVGHRFDRPNAVVRSDILLDAVISSPLTVVAHRPELHKFIDVQKMNYVYARRLSDIRVFCSHRRRGRAYQRERGEHAEYYARDATR